LKPDEQEAQSNKQERHHMSSTQTEAFGYLDWFVKSLSIKDCPQKQKSLTTCLQSQRQASPLIKIILERVTRKCHFTQVCQHTV